MTFRIDAASKQTGPLYLAPMEGVTGYIYRRVHHEFFQPMDKYFIPFLSPTHSRSLKSRERAEISPENNQGMRVIPQVLTNQAEDFLWTAGFLAELGYQEINLNLGCPSGTVVSKGRGAGFLARPEELERCLDQIFSKVQVKVSIKTRIGIQSHEEFQVLLPLFNKYPLEELIIHPRIRTDFYRNQPNLEVYQEAVESSKNPICYNGDLFTLADYQALIARFPDQKAVMLGRGLIANPGLAERLRGEEMLTKQRLRAFHDCLLQKYRHVMSGERPVLFKMKELWYYMSHVFQDSERYRKKIKKAGNLQEYGMAVDALFRERELSEAGFCAEK